jgi:hypothetical protein
MLPRVVVLSSATFGCVYSPSVPPRFRKEKTEKTGKLPRARKPVLPSGNPLVEV